MRDRGAQGQKGEAEKKRKNVESVFKKDGKNAKTFLVMATQKAMRDDSFIKFSTINMAECCTWGF